MVVMLDVSARRWVLCLAALFLTACACIPAGGKVSGCSSGDCRPRVLFDEAHAERGTISYERAIEMDPAHGADWYLYGHVAEMLGTTYNLVRGEQSLTASSLAEFDALIIVSPTTRFTSDEVEAIYDFVMHGGGLLIAQDTNPSPSAAGNQLADLFGGRFLPGILRSERGDWDAESFQADISAPEHPIAHGVATFQLNWGCAITPPAGWDVLVRSKSNTWLDADNSRRQNGSEPVGPLDVAAAGYAGAGRVVLIGDNAFQDTIMEPNWVLFCNAVAWLVGEPTQAANWSPIDNGNLEPVVSSATSSNCLVRFFPDRWAVDPGDTIVWTIEATDAAVLPLYIRPELDNDIHREPLVILEHANIRIEFTYDHANIYIPYLEVVDSTGYGQKVYPERLITVRPGFEQRASIGLSLASSASSQSDLIKAIRVTTCDSSLYKTQDGLEDIHQQLVRIAGLGTNLVVFNLEWLFDNASASIQEPLYGATWPISTLGTVPLDVLVKLVDWSHALGMRVGLCYFLTEKEGYLPGKRGRYTYKPEDDRVYLEWQTAIHVAYAEICQLLGVELFILDAENDYFTQNPGVVDLIHEVREVYGGALTEQAYTIDRVWSCPFAHQLDFVAWSDYYFGFADLSNRGLDISVLKAAFLRHYEADVLPVLRHVGRPGMFLELGANFREIGDEQGEVEYRAYLEVIAQVTSGPSPLIGLCWWDWALLGEDHTYPHSLRGRGAEQVVSEFYSNTLPNSVNNAAAEEVARSCSGKKILASFEQGENLTLHTYNDGGQIKLSYDSTLGYPGRSAHIRFTPYTAERQVSTAGLYIVPARSEDWTQQSSVCFWLLNDAENCNCVSVLEFQVIDADGDQFTFRTSARTFLAGWQLITVDLDLLSFPSWIPSSQPGDGVLDLRRVAKWGFILQWDDGRTHDVWIDTVLIGRGTAGTP